MTARCTPLAVLLLPALGAAQAREVTLEVAPGTIEVAQGMPQNAWLYNGTLPGPTLRMRADETLRVRVINRLPDPTTVHWHGQDVPQGMDGVPGISRPRIAPGEEFVYELVRPEPGTYWYHPHVGHDQIDIGLHGVLIVDPTSPSADPPFDADHLVVIDDWAPRLGGNPPFFGTLINGRNSDGQADITVQPGQRVRLRLVNVAALTNYIVALDGHMMTVTHSDGRRVQPVTVEALAIGIGERYDVIVQADNPGVWSLAVALIDRRDVTQVRGVVRYAGQTQPPPAASYVPRSLQFGILLGYNQLASYAPGQPITATPDRRLPAVLDMDQNGQHTINGEAWPMVTPMVVSSGEQVQIDMTNRRTMYHPMHVHGHTFLMMGTAGGTANPPRKDTILVQPRGRSGADVSVQMVTDNPGRWLFHCHDSFHMSNGMMALLQYDGDADGDRLPDAGDFDPLDPFPVLTISEWATAFRPGGSGTIDVQWPAGETAAVFAAASELATPLSLPPFGRLWLPPGAVLLGSATAGTDNRAQLAYTLPAEPGLIDQAVALQAAATTSAPGMLRLSTPQRLWIRQ